MTLRPTGNGNSCRSHHSAPRIPGVSNQATPQFHFGALLLASSLLVIGLSGIGVAVYTVGPNVVSSVKGSVIADVSGSTERTGAGSPSVPGPSGSDEITLDASKAITATEPLTGSLKIATAIANHFKVSVADITKLHDGGWGYGEIFKLYALAQASGKTVAEIKAMRDSGEGWGQIAKALNQSPGNHGNNLGSIMRQGNGNPPTEHGNGKGKSPGAKGGNKGKGDDEGEDD